MALVPDEAVRRYVEYRIPALRRIPGPISLIDFYTYTLLTRLSWTQQNAVTVFI